MVAAERTPGSLATLAFCGAKVRSPAHAAALTHLATATVVIFPPLARALTLRPYEAF